MDAKGLSMNDWLLADGTPVQVTSLSLLGGDVIGVLSYASSRQQIYASNAVALSRGARSSSLLKPVPLTGKMLEDNGFEHRSTLWLHRIDGNPMHYDFKLEDSRGMSFFLVDIGIYKIFIHSVHELQHVLRACCMDRLADSFMVTQE